MKRIFLSLAVLTVAAPVLAGKTYVDWDRPLEGVREVAFLPPVSGG